MPKRLKQWVGAVVVTAGFYLAGPAVMGQTPVTLAELANQNTSGVSVLEVSDYAPGHYTGALTPSPPHADSNAWKAVVIFWKDHAQRFVFSHEASYCPLLELTNGAAMCNQFFEGNYGDAELFNNLGRKEKNSSVEIRESGPERAWVRWTYSCVNMNDDTQPRLRGTEDYFAYTNGLVLRRMSYESLMPGDTRGYSTQPVELFGVAPVGVLIKDLFPRDTQNGDYLTHSVLDLYADRRYDIFWADGGVGVRREGNDATLAAISQSPGCALVMPFKEGYLFAIIGTNCGFVSGRNQLIDHSTPGAEGGAGWGQGLWDHWPIGWLNSQTSYWQPGSPYPYSFGSIGQFFVPDGQRIRNFGADYSTFCQNMELNLWTEKRTFSVLLGVARDFEEVRRIGRAWLDKGAACNLPESIADLGGPTWPGAPSSLGAESGDAQVSLSWTAPAYDGDSAITDYVIEFKPTAGSAWAAFDDGICTVTTAVVTGLTNGLSYDFRVAAVNAKGVSPVSLPCSVTPGMPVMPDGIGVGGAVAHIGNYRIHTFTNNGAFSIGTGRDLEVLVVGGGGGGAATGGGGGAGGVIRYQTVTVTPGNYAVTIGDGGDGGLYDGAEHYGGNGGNSSFSGGAVNLMAAGGGGGAAYIGDKAGAAGGSGGGGRGYSSAPGGAANGIGIGNNGGAAAGDGDSPNYGSGGGGGYAAAGGAGTGTAGGNGGAGLPLDPQTAPLEAFTGMTVIASGGGGCCYWGGGGSAVGTAGSGGTGAGYGGATGANAGGHAVSFGSGGGGGGQSVDGIYANGGNGAPGVVVVRYPVGPLLRTPVAGYLADFKGTNFPAHWRYQWNANGPFGDTNHYVDLVWNDSVPGYFTDATAVYPSDRPAPAHYLQLRAAWGYPGSGVSSGPFIWAHEVGPLVGYTVSAPGSYSVEGHFCYYPEMYVPGTSTGVGLKIYVNNTLSGELYVTGTATNTFSTILGSLNAGDTIYVALAPGVSAASDATDFDFTIILESGAPKGTLMLIR
jgi:hypothetical protein